MTSENEELIAKLIEGAEEVRDPATSEERGEKPRLLVESCNPDQSVAALRDLLAGAGGLYDRGVPVRLAFDQSQRGTVAQVMTPDALVLMAHKVCRPYVLKARQDGTVAGLMPVCRGRWRSCISTGAVNGDCLAGGTHRRLAGRRHNQQHRV
jgi:hypothetical protein